jgi:glycosyltransferase involved in cell wall biosynthesis
MRVGFLTHYASLFGANRSLLDLIRGLKPHGVESFVVAPEDGRLAEVLREEKIPVALIPFESWFAAPQSKASRWWRLRQNLKALRPLVAQLRAWDVDVVYSNSSVTPVGALAAMRLGRPHLWHLRELADLHYGWRHDWGAALFRRLVARADAQICISNTVRDHFRLNNCRVIYNGVAWQADFEKLRQHRRVGSPYTFAMVGAIHPSKQQHVAIRALAKLNGDSRLLIAGCGDSGYEQHCRQLAAELCVGERVKFCGYVENPFEVYAESDAVLVCSRHEAMGRSTAEAMAAARPVIGFDEAGTSEIVEHEKTGLLYRGGADELAACMRRFVEQPEWARQLGEQGWQLARRKFTIEAYANAVNEVLLQLRRKK